MKEIRMISKDLLSYQVVFKKYLSANESESKAMKKFIATSREVFADVTTDIVALDGKYYELAGNKPVKRPRNLTEDLSCIILYSADGKADFLLMDSSLLRCTAQMAEEMYPVRYVSVLKAQQDGLILVSLGGGSKDTNKMASLLCRKRVSGNWALMREGFNSLSRIDVQSFCERKK